jgi:Ca-activated chloride channel family protein
MDGMRFASPYALGLLVLVPVLAALLLRRRGDRPGVIFGSLAAAGGARRTWRVRLEPMLPALRLAAVVLLVLAIARPQRGEAGSARSGNGIDIVLAFDASSSMSLPFAQNRTRMDAAKDVVSRFVQARTNDRVGLVIFQGASLTMSPLTTDYGAIAQEVRDADRVHLKDGTAIGVAIGESVNLLRGSNAASRIVILLTDGENNSTTIEPLAAGRIAEKLGVRVYTVGVVSRGRNPGQSTLNVDEQSLRDIASATGGTYGRAEDPAALQQIYDNIDQLEKSRFEDREFTRFNDVAPIFLAAAAALLAIELALRSTLFRRLA